MPLPSARSWQLVPLEGVEPLLPGDETETVTGVLHAEDPAAPETGARNAAERAVIVVSRNFCVFFGRSNWAIAT